MFSQKFSEIKEGYTFDDVLLKPIKSPIEPREADVSTKLSRHIRLGVPIVSSPMDTVTEDQMAIAMARYGAVGVIHRNMSTNEQIEMVKKVKKEETLIIRNVISVDPETPVNVARTIMITKNIAGLPVVSGGKLVGILTKRDLEFSDSSGKIRDIMTKNVITADENVSIEDAKYILYKNRIEKLPLVDKAGKLKGLITAKDIKTREKYPNASRDTNGQLMVGAAIGAYDIDRAINLEKAGADFVVIDTAHAHNCNVISSLKKIRKELSIDIIAGNIATAEAAEDLISAGVDGLRVGIGPGSICTTRIVAGVGVPQLTAISSVADVAVKHDIPVIADGGIRYSGDMVKALAAGASTVMLGSLLAGTEESPGVEMIINGRKYKSYRGMGSIGAIKAGKSDRYGKLGNNEFIAEGVEGSVPYRGHVSENLFQFVGGIKTGMGYIGAHNLDELRKNSVFIRITNNGLKESHPHDIRIVSEPPNYQNFNY
ncbi:MULTISPECIES: IMP dehydrogenase [Acidiplasma]|uniref:Inosine-5'-monophosphate dehydrogenase n=1 Tax=Acidiplasma aeolicum TaxID=507754 RepID=A0A0Q0WF23_9ARCH|nr:MULTISPECIES: IMP dehydrogenase [Acidiplasma]KJE48911.1 inosine-5-monophosphate dehydrogenase [Acidiplasma sp. MBA-1]KPV46420.1 inosine-5-monophosphate dehydrogenase [Acidiplasma aeolicum]KQB33977.1 inosine-5'-monophosphate dehydrogenase [Acidiplasma aeolicum]WMT54322.1 MAG: IMP dehydrogenase [Acidiplasma sp.]